MTRLLLDTTFLIDVERGDAVLDEFIEDADDVAVAAITFAELRVGVLQADGRRRDARSGFFEAVRAAIPSLPYDDAVADAHSDLLASVRLSGLPRGAHDLIIAATAKAAGRVVVSADESAFVGLPGVETRSHR